MKNIIKRVCLFYTSILLACLSTHSLASPNVVEGSAVIDYNTVTETTIGSQSASTINNWNDFDISPNEVVNFHQKLSTGSVLLNAYGMKPAQIHGELNVFGTLFLINPDGIFVGDNASIRADRIILSTLAIQTIDYLNGNYSFTQQGEANPVIINGNIVANEIWLMGGIIELLGSLQTPDGGSINVLTGLNHDIEITMVPLPSAAYLFISGFLGLFGIVKRRRLQKDVYTIRRSSLRFGRDLANRSTPWLGRYQS